MRYSKFATNWELQRKWKKLKVFFVAVPFSLQAFNSKILRSPVAGSASSGAKA
jgi:hypothetical protein